MNLKGQAAPSSIPLAIVIALFLFMAGTLFVGFIQNSVTDARSNLSCSGIPSTGGQMLTCLFVDAVVPYLIIVVLSTAGGYILARLLI